MKKLLLFAAIMIGAAGASQAGVRVNFDLRLPVPLPTPPRVVISQPAPCPPPVVAYEPVCEPAVPARVITPNHGPDRVSYHRSENGYSYKWKNGHERGHVTVHEKDRHDRNRDCGYDLNWNRR